MKRAAAALVLGLAASSALADELVQVCYNYGCFMEEVVVFWDGRLAWVRELLAAAATPEREREYLALAIGQLYGWAAEQTPIGADRGGNYADEGEPGGMDCVDHSTTTTRFLRMIEGRGWLRFHRVGEVVSRNYRLIGEHLSASIEQKESGERFAVDSWFVDNGEPAVMLPLDQWESGGGPDVY